MTSQGIGGRQQALVVKLILAGQSTNEQLAAGMKGHSSGITLERLLANLRSVNLIVQTRKGWAVTSKGQALLATGYEMPPIVPLKLPVVPPRRPGSEVASKLPSCVANQVLERRFTKA